MLFQPSLSIIQFATCHHTPSLNTGKLNENNPSLKISWNPSHFRETGQGTTDEIRSRDLRKELEEREEAVKPSSSTKSSSSAVRRALEANAKRQKLEQNPDADDPIDSDNSDDDSDSDDDTAALMAELNKIKSERAQDEAKRDAERAQEEERIRMENILSGNPLLNYSSAQKSGAPKVKRRWNDDVVFKNCARTESDKPADFVNDSLRSQFHRKFMEKYIKWILFLATHCARRARLVARLSFSILNV